MPPGTQHDFVAEMPGSIHDITRVLERQRAVAEERRMDGFGGMPHRWMFWCVITEVRLNIASMRWPLKMSPVICLVGGIYLSAASGNLARQLSLRDLIEKTVFAVRVDLVGVAKADLGIRQSGSMRELLVDKLRCEHGRRLIHGIGCGQVVIFARIDDDAGIRVEHAAEVLIDEGSLHVDVAKEMPYIDR